MIQPATPKNTEKNTCLGEGAAHSTADGAENISVDANLRTIIDQWPGLPEDVKQEILDLASPTR